MTKVSIAFLLAAAPTATTPDNKMNIWIPVVAALLASAITGLISWAISWQRLSHDRRMERLRFMRSKLEETHETGRSILVAFLDLHTRLSMVVATQAHPNTMEVVTNTPIERSGGGTSRLRMLVEFYCPKLLPELEAVEQTVQRQMTLHDRVLHMTLAQNPLPANLSDSLTKTRDELRNAINDFHSALSRVAQSFKA